MFTQKLLSNKTFLVYNKNKIKVLCPLPKSDKRIGKSINKILLSNEQTVSHQLCCIEVKINFGANLIEILDKFQRLMFSGISFPP